jgi:hypothetical protein
MADMYFAMGSGVTPNQASSVIQMPWSYCSQILNRWNQYLDRVRRDSFYASCSSYLLLQLFRELVDMQPLVNTRFVWLGRHVAH